MSGWVMPWSNTPPGHPKRICARCGREFEPNCRVQKYCCRECAKSAERERERA